MPRDRWLPPIRCMHEWSLVLFTALAVPGAGIGAAALVASILGLAPPDRQYVYALAAGLLVGGLVFSVLHLGRPVRAPLALARIGRNALSTEVAVLSVACALALFAIVPLPPDVRPAVVRTSGAASLALLCSFGPVYFLRGRAPWRGPIVLGPLVSGLAAGFVILRTAAESDRLQAPALALLALDAGLSLLAWRGGERRGWLPAHPAVFEYRRRLLSLRLLFANVLPAGLLLAGFAPSAAIAAVFGGLLDRFSFYGLAQVKSTEAEVADVERAIVEAAH